MSEPESVAEYKTFNDSFLIEKYLFLAKRGEGSTVEPLIENLHLSTEENEKEIVYEDITDFLKEATAGSI